MIYLNQSKIKKDITVVKLNKAIRIILLHSMKHLMN